MRRWAERGTGVLRSLFESVWNFLGSLAAVSLFAAVLGLGIFHAVVYDEGGRCCCYAGVHNPAGAELPRGIQLMGEKRAPGVPHVRLEYDRQGRLQRLVSVDAEGSVCPLPGSRVAEQRMGYNAAGQLIRRENRGAGGVLVEDAQGVAVREFEYDSAGRHVRSRFLNAAGELVAPLYPGYAECRISYDAQGRPASILHLGADGKPAPDAQGEELVRYEYGEDGSVVRRNLVDGVPADNIHGIAAEKCRPQESGTCRSWLDAAGNPVVHPQLGAATLHQESRASVHLERCRFLGVDGTLQTVRRACAEHLVRCNAQGLPEWEFYGGADGLPVDNRALGYAERVCIYDAAGALQREYFWDAAGNPAPLCERRHTSTPHGHYTLSLHTDGSTNVEPR